jgi:predicted SAM-dependent methyltransferase
MKNKLYLGATGCGDKDAVTVDIDPALQPEVVHDLNKTPWPFEENSFSEVICHHVIEHLEELPKIMKELYRITKPSGRIYIEVPHYSSYHANTAEHRMRFNYFTFDSYFENGPGWQRHEFRFSLIKKELTFHRVFRRYMLHKLWNKKPKTYERFWAYAIPAEHIKLSISPVK